MDYWDITFLEGGNKSRKAPLAYLFLLHVDLVCQKIAFVGGRNSLEQERGRVQGYKRDQQESVHTFVNTVLLLLLLKAKRKEFLIPVRCK